MLIRRLKIAAFLLCLLPITTLGWCGTHEGLGGNPTEFITHSTGDWTLRFLLITLAVTPARSVLGIPRLIRFRRMLGLFAFFYGCLHFLTYIWLDKFFDIQGMLRDVGKRPFITIGFASLLLMVPLATTSTAKWIRRLGGETLAAAAPAYLLECGGRRDPLLLACEIGCQITCLLRCASGRSFSVSFVLINREAAREARTHAASSCGWEGMREQATS
jgi:Ferric reductase like transmembrane component